MLTVLLVPDGAADPLGATPTCLEQAVTPALDRLAARGRLLRVRTIPAGMPAGSEVGLPALLGVPPTAPPGRGQVEAAAAGVRVAPGEAAWRLDLVPARAPAPGEVARLGAALAPLGGRVHPLRGHRLLLVGPASWGDGPPGPHQTDRPLAEVAAGPFAVVTAAALTALGGHAAAWPWGRTGAGQRWPHLPRRLSCPVLVLCDGGAPAGVARLLGCTVVAGPPRRGAEIVADAPAHAFVVVHDPRPDDAGHARDRAGKVRALEAFDREVVAPVADVVLRRGGHLLVSADHGCDPATGCHTSDPVPALVCRSGARAAAAPEASAPPHPPRAHPRPRLTERAVAGLPADTPPLPLREATLPGPAGRPETARSDRRRSA